MDWRLFTTVFVTVLVAEMGDKTQLATMLYASGAEHPKLVVFAGAALALVVASAVGVIAGAGLSRVISPRILSYVAGAGFVLVGLWTLAKA